VCVCQGYVTRETPTIYHGCKCVCVCVCVCVRARARAHHDDVNDKEETNVLKHASKNAYNFAQLGQLESSKDPSSMYVYYCRKDPSSAMASTNQ